MSRNLTTELARALVNLTADQETQERYEPQTGKRTEGQLTPSELEELESLVRVNTLLGVLKAEAQAVLAGTNCTIALSGERSASLIYSTVLHDRP